MDREKIYHFLLSRTRIDIQNAIDIDFVISNLLLRLFLCKTLHTKINYEILLRIFAFVLQVWTILHQQCLLMREIY